MMKEISCTKSSRAPPREVALLRKGILDFWV
jgi:hypothetical protein